MDREIKICVIGLGYVGLPLARLFSTKYNTVGFCIKTYAHSLKPWAYSMSFIPEPCLKILQLFPV